MEFVTVRKADIYNSNVVARWEVQEGTRLVCADWVWPEGKDLAGMRTILEGEYIGKFVKDADLEVYMPPTPEPFPVKYTIEVSTEGELRVFDETGAIIWQSGIA